MDAGRCNWDHGVRKPETALEPVKYAQGSLMLGHASRINLEAPYRPNIDFGYPHAI